MNIRICQSHSGIMPKRLNTSSEFFHQLDVDDYKKLYRPVTNTLSTFSEILERFALVTALDVSSLSSPLLRTTAHCSQLHSTETALVKIVDDVLAAIDRGHFGVTGTCLQWITSYTSPNVQIQNASTLQHPSVLQPTLAFHKDLYWGPFSSLRTLFARLHDANITQPSFVRISIGYRCVAESTTRLQFSATKPSNCNNLRFLLVYSRHTDSRVF